MDSDMSDARVKEGKEAMAAFRRIREEFENLVTGVL